MTVFLCVSVFLCAVLLMGQVPEIKWIGLDWIGILVADILDDLRYAIRGIASDFFFKPSQVK